MTALGASTVGEALDGARTAIAASGSPSARLDAEVLLAHAMGVDRAAFVTDPDAAVPTGAVRAFQDAVRRRSVGHEPVAYITGRRGFRHLELAVDARVLVPRPETELLVEVALGLGLAPGARVCDIGTGSGAVALALADERPDLRLTATDTSAGALDVARTNAAALGLDGRVAFTQADLLPEGERFDAVLGNPPYVAEADRATLPPDVVHHEPEGALFAGVDGLDVLRRLVVAAAAAAPVLVVEIGAGQAAAVEELLRAAGWSRVRRHRDLAGIERVLEAHR